MKRALIVSGGYAPHQPETCGEILRGLLEAEGMTVRHRLTLDAYDDEDLAGYDLIVPNWTVGEISVPTAKRIWAAVAGGVGLGGFHGGMIDAFRNSDRFRFIAGGSYVAEPGAICRYRVTIAAGGDPITEGIGDFDYQSEQYYMHMDPAVTVLATTRFTAAPYPWLEGVAMPVVWKKPFGLGRVFVSALGHGPQEFDHPQMHRILLRGLLWACR
ncbi:MAG: ThuA domain-containing protein [Rhodobacteraceae bacterium]|nr:ThuA domain-containing protein [Paracoccaceae bacterium]